MKDVNLRQVFAAFTERSCAGTRELMAGGTLLGELKGAARCTCIEGRALLAARHARHRRGGRDDLLSPARASARRSRPGIIAAEAVAADRDGAADAATRAGFEAPRTP